MMANRNDDDVKKKNNYKFNGNSRNSGCFPYIVGALFFIFMVWLIFFKKNNLLDFFAKQITGS